MGKNSLDKLQNAFENGNKLTLSEARATMEAFFVPNNYDYGIVRVPVAIGERGVGKTSMLKDMAAAKKAELRVFNADSTESEDVLGLPYISEDPESGQKIQRHAAELEIFRAPRSESGMGVFVIDEIGAANPEVKSQIREIASGQLGDLKVHPNWVIYGTTNPCTEQYTAVKADDWAIADRFFPVPMHVTKDETLDYWRKYDVLPEMLYSFLLMNKNYIMGADVSPRTWSSIGDSLKKFSAAGLPRNLAIKNLQNQTSQEIAVGYATYLERGNDKDKYPILWEDLLQCKGEEKKEIRARLEKWVQEGQTALVGATKQDLVSHLTKKDLPELTSDELKNFFSFLDAIADSYMEIVDDLLYAMKNGKSISKFLKEIVPGTRLEKQLRKAYKDHLERTDTLSN